MSVAAACGPTTTGTLTASPSASAAPSATLSPPATPTKIKLGYVSVSSANSAIWSAAEGGYLAKYSLAAEIVNIADSPLGVAAMLSGEVPINCGISGTAVVGSALGGSDLAFYAVTVNVFPSVLLVRPGINTMADLRGKVVAVSRFGTASDSAGRLAFRQAGMDPAKDATFVQLGGLPEILAGLKAGQVDCGVLSPPITVQARQAGFKELVDMGKTGIEYAFNGVVTTRAYASKNPQLLEGVLKALIEGVHRFKTDTMFGKAVTAKWGKLTDQEQIDESYQLFAGRYLKEPPFPSDAGLRTVLDEVAQRDPKAQGALPSSFYDLSFLRKLQDNGFIKSVTG